MRVSDVFLVCVYLLAISSAGESTLSKRDKKGTKKKEQKTEVYVCICTCMGYV